MLDLTSQSRACYTHACGTALSVIHYDRVQYTWSTPVGMCCEKMYIAFEQLRAKGEDRVFVHGHARNRLCERAIHEYSHRKRSTVEAKEKPKWHLRTRQNDNSVAQKWLGFGNLLVKFHDCTKNMRPGVCRSVHICAMRNRDPLLEWRSRQRW